MSLAIPKKKKLIRVIIIIASRIETFLDQDIENTSSEELFDEVVDAKPTLYSFDSNESNWSQNQQDAWTAFEAIETALDPLAPSDVSEAQIQDLTDAFTEAVRSI